MVRLALAGDAVSAAALPGMVSRVSAGRRPILGSALLLLALITGAVFGRDLVVRRRAAGALSELGLGSRPEVLESVALCEQGDLAAAFAAEAVLAELSAGTPSSGAPGRYEARGKRALASARDLAADAAGERPGSALHRLLLARAGYAIWDLEARPAAASTRRWMETFRLAGNAAPGLDLIWASAADTCLAAWPRLSAAEREEALFLLRRAFLSSDSVRRSFHGAWRVLGTRAIELLPDSPGPVREGAAALRSMGETGAALALEQRGGGRLKGAGNE